MADNNVNRFSREDAANANNMAQAARSLTEELKDQLGIRSRLNETERETLNLARQLQASAQQNTIEIGNAGSIERQITKDIKTNLALRRELLDTEGGRSKTLKKELENLKEKAKLGDEEYINLFQTVSKEAQRISLLEQSIDLSNELINQRKEEAKVQKDINSKMGVTGALVKGTGALMERLGMRSGIFQDAMKESAEEMRKMAEETVRGEANFSKLQIMAKGFSELAKGFGKALFDPLTIITAIVSKAFELNTASVKLQRLTGQVRDVQASHNQSLASGAQVMEVMAEMTERTGIAASAMFTSKDLGRLAEAKNLLGLSAEQASNLGMLSKASGTSIQGYKEQVVSSVNEFNALNDSAVAHGVIMQDVLNTSADVSMSLGGSAPKIAAAAAAARKLGLDLTKVNQIADGLLDFESSIGNELEAQLLTGKNINLSKARELALNNDLEGVANELAKNGASAAEFANMNRIQQEGMAKALGMSREEMGKMLINQEGQKNLSKEQRAAMRGITLEQLEQMEASESLKLAFSKIAEPLASILNTLAPIVTMIAKAVAFIAPIATPIFLAVKAFQLLNSGILGSIKNMGKLLTSTSLFGKFYKGGQFMPGGGRATAGGQKAGGLLSSLFGNKGKAQVPQGTGETAGKGITSISESISKIDMKKVLQGAAAMTVVAGAMFIFGKAIQEFEKIEDWSGVAAGLTAFTLALGATAVIASLAAPALYTAAPAILAFGAATLMLGAGIGLAAAGMSMFVESLSKLNMSSIGPMLLLGPALFSIAAGLGAISVAGLAAIPALAALSGFALAATPLIALGGLFGDGGDDNDGFAKLEAKLDTLISVVSAGGNVYLDGNKVGEAQVLGTYKLA